MAGIKDTAISNKQLAISHPKKPNSKTKIQTRNSAKASKARARRARRSDDGDRVTTFPEVKSKVVREVRFSHHDSDSVLAIAFKDRTVLVFEVGPEPLVLPVDIRAHYIGERRSAAKTWEGLGGRVSSR